jgi:hypothetical protein
LCMWDSVVANGLDKPVLDVLLADDVVEIHIKWNVPF